MAAPDFINVGTGKPEPLAPEDVAPALAAGTHTPIGSKPLVSTDGKLELVADGDVQRALAQGYTLPTQELLTDFANQAKYGTGVGSEAKAFGEGALRGATLGVSDFAPGKFARKERQERNPVSATTGELAGGIGSMALAPEASPMGMIARGGEAITGALVPEALAEGSSLASRVLNAGQEVGAKALGSAAEGLAFGAGSTVSEAALGDPDLNGEKVVANLGLGALLGGALGGVLGAGKIAKAAAEDASLSSTLVKKIARVTTGLDERAFERYMARPDEVNAAGSFQDVVDHFLGKVEEAQSDVSIGSSKGYQILDDSGKTFKADEITQPLLDAATKIEARGQFSPRLKQAVDNIMAMAENAENVAVKTKGTLTGPQVKNLIQSLDNETKFIWQQGLGNEGQIGSRLRTARGEIDKVLKSAVPDYAEHMKSVAADTTALKDVASRFRTPNGASNLLKRIMNGKDEFAARALNSFDSQFETTFNDDLKDSWAKAAFNKETTQGSRKTVGGAVLGNFLGGGGPIGSAIGAAVGATADKYGTTAVKKLIDGVKYAQEKLGNKVVTPDSAAHALSMLGDGSWQKLDTPALGTAIHLISKGGPQGGHTNHHTSVGLGLLGKHVDKTAVAIDKSIEPLFTKGTPTVLPEGPFTERLSHQQRLSKVKDKIDETKAHLSVEKLTQSLDKATRSGFDMAPKVMGSIQQTAIRGLQFLQAKMPVTAPPSPFEKALEPSVDQLQAFDHYYRAVHDPLSVLTELKSGIVRPESLETLNAVYPKLYAEMKQTFIEHAGKIEDKSTIPYKTKLVLSRFIGQPLDQSLTPESIQMYQAAGSLPAANQGQGSPHPSAKGMEQLNLAANTATDFQRTGMRERA